MNSENAIFRVTNTACVKSSEAFSQELGDRHATSDAFMRKDVLLMNNLWRTNGSGVKDTHMMYVHLILILVVFWEKKKRLYIRIAQPA